MPQWVRPLLTSALIDIMNERSYLPIAKLKTDVINPGNLDAIAGMYNIKEIGKVQISIRDSKAILKVDDGMEYHMHLVDSSSFYIPGLDPWVSFDSLKNNKFQNIHWSSTTVQRSGKRILN
jgi:hypothetical protein